MNETIVAERMRQLRNTLKLNQKEFCKQIELSQGRLSDIESGNTKPSFNTLLAISERFSVSLDWLIAGKGQMFIEHQGAISQMDLSADETQLISQYRKLTERQKGRIDQQVDNYVEENKRSSPSLITDDVLSANLA